jgi:energy-coupling factor transporter ATP-binding protein EcfA2
VNTQSRDETAFDDEEERCTYRRRLFTYSADALRRGLALERIYVNHTDFQAVLQSLDRVYQLAVDSSMPHGVIVVGPTGTGKSSVFRYFRDAMPPSTEFELATGALTVRLQERPNVGRLVSALLRQLRYPFTEVSKQTVSLKKDLLIDALRQKGTRAILLDEAHHMCHGRRFKGDLHEGSEITEFLRELMDEVRVALVLAGTSTLDRLPLVDAHLASRLVARIELHNFEVLPRFMGFAKAFITQCASFDCAGLLQPDMATLWHKATAGNPRSFKRLLVETVLVSIEAKASGVERRHCAVAFERVRGRDSLAANPFAEGNTS